MRVLSVLFPMTLLASTYALACASDPHQPATRKGWKSYFASHVAVSKRSPSSSDGLPTAKSNPWGGSDPQKWTAEAIVANAASAALNAGWAQADVKDVLVAVPVQMSFSNLRPYGDGQTNAAVGFGAGWVFSQPPLVATLIQYNSGASALNLHFDSAVVKKAGKVQMRFQDTTLLSNEIAVGQQDVAWSIDANQGPQWGDLFTNRVSFVQVPGSADWFPIDFRNVVKSTDEMLAEIPNGKQALGKGNLLDPEMVSVQKKSGDAFPFQNMGDEHFGQDINADRYFPVPGSGIHNEFPTASGGVRQTAVGHGNTLVMVRPPAPFKLAYICFDKRDPEAEAKFGVPSGGGWHEIGDPAETVMNTLEKAPVVFGYANGRPVAAPPSGQFAYGLADIAVIRELKPGFALITAGGDTTRAEDASGWQNRGSQKNKPEGRNYHWFAFHQTHEVCGLEWVHPKVPAADNHLGFD